MPFPRSFITFLASLIVFAAQSRGAVALDEGSRSALSLDLTRQSAVGTVLTEGDGAPDALATALVELGPAHLPEIFAVLIDGHVTLVEGGEARAVQLSPKLAAPVRLALAQEPRAELRSFLRALAEGRPNEAEQRTALDVVGGLGDRDDLALLVELAEPARGTSRADRDVRAAFDRALGLLRKRHAFTARELGQAYLEAHPSYAVSLIDAMGACEASEALEQLAGLLGRVSEADALVLAKIGAVGAGLPAPVDSSVTTRTRGYLTSVRSELVVEAVVVAGKLRDVGAIGELVRALGDPLAAPRANEVLRSLSGQRLTGAAAWEAWYAGELAWWEGEARERLAMLDFGTPAEVGQVLMEISRKRLFRDELAPIVAESMARQEADLIRVACSVLGHLGSAVVVDDLEALLEHDSTAVQSAARDALRQILGSYPRQ